MLTVITARGVCLIFILGSVEDQIVILKYTWKVLYQWAICLVHCLLFKIHIFFPAFSYFQTNYCTVWNMLGPFISFAFYLEIYNVCKHRAFLQLFRKSSISLNLKVEEWIFILKWVLMDYCKDIFMTDLTHF